MRYLLDTHVILWIAFNDEKISSSVRKILLSQDAEIYLSTVSFWEISIKFQMGKLDLKHHTPETILTGFDQNFEYRNLDLNFKDVVSFFQLKQTHHKDPFDRMLIWQALKDDLALISDDENIKRYKDTGLKVLW